VLERRSSQLEDNVIKTATELPRLSTLFTDRKLAAIFAAAERDVPPAAIGVTNQPAPLLPSRGAAERVVGHA
jgi:hypothetical protein